VVNLYLKKQKQKSTNKTAIYSRNFEAFSPDKNIKSEPNSNLSKKNTTITNTSFNKNINSYLFSVFNKTNDKSTDISKMNSIKSSVTNLPLISKKGTTHSITRRDLKSNTNSSSKPVKLNTTQSKGAGDNLLGINPNILMSPRSANTYSGYFNYNKGYPQRQTNEQQLITTMDNDSMEIIKDTSTRENIFDSKKTLTDLSMITKRVEPFINDINKSKFYNSINQSQNRDEDRKSVLDTNNKTEIEIFNNEGYEGLTNGTKLDIISSNQAGGLNQSIVVNNLKKITINLKDEESDNKDDFKIKLKRIETIKEENEEISKLNITLYKRQNSHYLDIKSVSDNTVHNEGERNDFIKIRLINKQNSMRFVNTRFDLTKILDEHLGNVDSSESSYNTISQAETGNKAISNSEANRTINSRFKNPHLSSEETQNNILLEEKCLPGNLSPILKRTTEKFVKPFELPSENTGKNSKMNTESYIKPFEDISKTEKTGPMRFTEVSIKPFEESDKTDRTEQQNDDNEGINFKEDTKTVVFKSEEEEGKASEIEPAVGVKNFIRSTKRIMGVIAEDGDKRKSNISHSGNIIQFRNSLVKGLSKRNVRKGISLGDNLKQSISSRDFSSSSDEGFNKLIQAKSQPIEFEIYKKEKTIIEELSKQEKTLKPMSDSSNEEELSDFERRMKKLRKRLSFNFDKMLLEADDGAEKHKESFKFEKEILALINSHYKQKTKEKKKFRLLDYYKINLKYIVKDFLSNEKETTFSTSIYEVKRNVVLQDNLNQFLKKKYLNITIDTKYITEKENEIVSNPEPTIFKNFNIDDELPLYPVVRCSQRKRTLNRTSIQYNAIFLQNKKHFNNYLFKDIDAELLDEEGFLEDYNSDDTILVRKTQKDLIMLGESHRDDSNNSSINAKLKHIMNSNRNPEFGDFIKQRCTKFLTKAIRVPKPNTLSILANPNYFKKNANVHHKKSKKIM
jgi:hypothetical protein